MFKKIIIFSVLCLFLVTPLFAQEEEEPKITVKQGFLYGYQDQEIKNLTTIEVIKTKSVDGLGKWNALIDGWSLDVGFAYDGDSLNTGAILLGRELGTLGDYLPLDFPLKEYINVSLYVIGIRADDLFKKPELQACSGGAFLKLGLSF